MIETKFYDGILEIIMSYPPVNALGEDVRKGLSKAVADAQIAEAVTALVIRGSGKLFSGGADINEFDRRLADPWLPGLVDMIEASDKPIVAAIHGMALGGGLELALGCHYRIATPTAKLGLPEVTLGLLPGAGGTQRLPRLIGVQTALEMIVTGRPLPATTAIEIGLIDKLADQKEFAREAIAFARTVKVPRRTGDRKAEADAEVFERFVAKHARKFKNLDAPSACIEAVKAATQLPIEQGQEIERKLFHELVGGKQSLALRHVFFAERAAAKVEGLPKDIALRSITKIGVIGAGTMGGGISMNFLSAGIPVTLVEMQQAPLDDGVRRIRKSYETTAAKGLLTTEQLEKAMSLVHPTLDFEALKDCDLIIEAVYEDIDVKKQLFARLDAIAKPGAILASNTSYLSINEIATATNRSQDLLGLHFFSPANIMTLVEVVRGAATAPDVLATGMALSRKIGKTPVVAGDCFGFIGNRMLKPRLEGAIQMLVEGATPAQVDRVSLELGMPMGPLQMIDLAGLDIGWHRDPTRIETVRDALNAQGRWGQKSGAGFYDYDETRRPSFSEAAQDIVEAFRARSKLTARDISDEEITVRTLYAIINEGAKILEEGIAQRASDIDVVWVHGYGWPRHTGGPMFWADKIGLKTIVDGLDGYRDAIGRDFTMSPLLRDCATSGKALGG